MGAKAQIIFENDESLETRYTIRDMARKLKEMSAVDSSFSYKRMLPLTPWIFSLVFDDPIFKQFEVKKIIIEEKI